MFLNDEKVRFCKVADQPLNQNPDVYEEILADPG
jgi:hypothetical protein